MSKDTKEIILAKREGYVRALRNEGYDVGYARRAADRAFPLPKKTVPRTYEEQGYVFRVVEHNGRRVIVQQGTGTPWKEQWYTPFDNREHVRLLSLSVDGAAVDKGDQIGSVIQPTATLFAGLADLLAKPTKEVEDDAEVSPC